MSQLQRRAVAGSFIFKFPDDDTTKKPQVALFRRSGKVRAYRHKYAPIAGSVEETDANPLATAWRELKEETTLTNTSLRLFRQGKPYSFVDESVDREWVINPFSFVLKSTKEGGRGEAGIQLDWEHEGYEWFDPDVVNGSDEFQGVPRILDSLRRVWFNIDLGEEAGRTLGNGLIALQSNHESSGHQISSKALEILVDVIKKLETDSREAWWKNARFTAWHLWKNGGESTGAPILSTMVSSLTIIEENLPHDGASLGGSINCIVQALEQYNQHRQNVISQVGASLDGFLTTHFARAEIVRILTLSSISATTSCITQDLKHSKTSLDIRVLESRPLFEDVNKADTIPSPANNDSTKANITVYQNASLNTAAKDIDLILVGADLIDQTGDVTNKTGLLPAILAAKHVSPGVKVIALFEKERIQPFGSLIEEENHPQDVAQTRRDSVQSHTDSSPRVEVKSACSDWVSSSLVDYYLTEDGVTGREGIADCAENIRKDADRFFTDL